MRCGHRKWTWVGPMGRVAHAMCGDKHHATWCYDCEDYVPLGPARDTPETAIEVRAQVLADAWMLPVWPATQEERAGCAAHISELVPSTPGELAGYLARCIATHEEEQTKLFPLCIGTTQLAPTNSQCMRCGRYGQRCDWKGETADAVREMGRRK